MIEISMAVALALLTIVANGAVTFGVVKTTLRFLEKEIAQVHSSARASHQRLDEHLRDYHSKGRR